MSEQELEESILDNLTTEREQRDPADGGDAFPCTPSASGWIRGMSLRDWFAGMAMQGLIANHAVWEETLRLSVQCGFDSNQFASMLAFGLSDAMLEERKRGTDAK